MVTIQLPPDFKEFFTLLNLEKTEYLLVGGYAVIHYGYVRSTGDMDIWFNPSPENAQRLVRVLIQFGLSEGSLMPEQFTEPGKVFQIGVPPLRIDLLTSITGCDFASCYAKRSVVEFDDVEVPIISLDELKTNKRATGRAKDQADLENLP